MRKYLFYRAKRRHFSKITKYKRNGFSKTKKNIYSRLRMSLKIKASKKKIFKFFFFSRYYKKKTKVPPFFNKNTRFSLEKK